MDNDAKRIVITKDEIDAAKVARGEKTVLLLEAAVTLSNVARDYFESKLSLAGNDLEYLTSLTGLIEYGSYDSVKWMFDDLLPGENLDMNDILHDLSETFGIEIERDALMLKALRGEMGKVEKPKDKNVVIVLKSTDVPGVEGRRGFYVLASLAADQQISVSNETGGGRKNEDGRQLVFLKPNFVACVEHTCATLYKAQKEEGKVAHFFDIHSRVEMVKGIVLDENGVAQFVLNKDDQGKNVTQNVEIYMLYALSNGIDSRVYRKMLPDTY